MNGLPLTHSRKRTHFRLPGYSSAVGLLGDRTQNIRFVELVRLADVLGGPDYEVSYPDGDRTAYVTGIYEARIISGSPAPGDGELSELAWFTPGQLPGLPLGRFSRALLHAAGRL